MMKGNRQAEKIAHSEDVIVLIVLMIVFLSSCAAPTSRSAGQSGKPSPPTSSRQYVTITGELALIASGFLPEPILQTREARYRLEVTKDSALPPDMVVGNMIAWSAGRYHVEGYLSDKMADVWNPTSRTLEKTPVLNVLRLTKSEKLQGDPCRDPTLTKTFPTWLHTGKPSDQQAGARHTIGETEDFITLIGYKFISHEPKLVIELRQDYLIYLGGRGVIVGRDGTKVLVGYECKQ